MSLRSSSCCNKIKKGEKKGQTGDIQTNIERYSRENVVSFVSIQHFFATSYFLVANIRKRSKHENTLYRKGKIRAKRCSSVISMRV